MRRGFACLVCLWLAGCAIFEQTPQDVQQKLANPTKGRLFERDSSERQ